MTFFRNIVPFMSYVGKYCEDRSATDYNLYSACTLHVG